MYAKVGESDCPRKHRQWNIYVYLTKLHHEELPGWEQEEENCATYYWNASVIFLCRSAWLSNRTVPKIQASENNHHYSFPAQIIPESIASVGGYA